jgi:hypothetical protein
MNKKKVDKIMVIALKLGVQVVNFSPPRINEKNTLRFSKYLLKIKRDTNISIAIQNVEPKFLFFIISQYKKSTLNELKRVTGDCALDLSGIDRASGMDILKAQKLL